MQSQEICVLEVAVLGLTLKYSVRGSGLGRGRKRYSGASDGTMNTIQKGQVWISLCNVLTKERLLLGEKCGGE